MIRHLGPMRSGSAIQSGAHQPHQPVASPTIDQNISQQFEALEAQRSGMRDLAVASQRAVQEGGNDVDELKIVSANEQNATSNARQQQERYYDKSVESTATSKRLTDEATILRSRARYQPENIARRMLMEAKLKEEEAKREEQKALENLAKAEETNRSVSAHSRAYNNAEEEIAQAVTTKSSNQSQANHLQNQSSSTNNSSTASSQSSSSPPDGSSSSFHVDGNGATFSLTTVRGGQMLTNTYHASTGNAYVDAAMALLAAIGFTTAHGLLGNTNPVREIAKNLTNKGFSEQASAYLEAALVDSVLRGTPTNQRIIFLKAQSSTLHGEAETNVAYWKEVLNENKQLGKQTHDLAKMA